MTVIIELILKRMLFKHVQVNQTAESEGQTATERVRVHQHGASTARVLTLQQPGDITRP